MYKGPSGFRAWLYSRFTSPDVANSFIPRGFGPINNNKPPPQCAAPVKVSGLTARPDGRGSVGVRLGCFIKIVVKCGSWVYLNACKPDLFQL
jgi:hypothetical protein